MNTFGSIYALINPVMPGLVKIGKTKRQVGERIQELSSATGVPTQFILVFEQKFINVDLAESQIHAILEGKGYRLSSNREFFNAPVADAIKVIQSIDGIFDGEFPINEDIIDVDIHTDDDEFGSLSNAKNSMEMQPWYDFWIIAESAYYGLGGEIQDFNQAMSYYAKAIKAGCPIAYLKIGEMYELGEGVSRPDLAKSLEYFKKGASEGDYYCYIKMAKLFSEDNNFDNARKCIDKYATNRKENINSIIEEERNIGNAVYDACFFSFEKDLISTQSKAYLSAFKDAAVEIADNRLSNLLENSIEFEDYFIAAYSEKLTKTKNYILQLN